MTEYKWNPGSTIAVELGCKCAQMDNHYGEGVGKGDDGNPVFWISEDCPLHGLKSKDGGVVDDKSS
jgi:hypothetical protein